MNREYKLIWYSFFAEDEDCERVVNVTAYNLKMAKNIMKRNGWERFKLI